MAFISFVSTCDVAISKIKTEWSSYQSRLCFLSL